MRSTNFSLVLNMDFQWCGYRLYTFMLSVKKTSFKTAFAIQTLTAQKMKFSIKDFFSKCDQIRSFLCIWSHLLKKSLMENSIFCVVIYDEAFLIQFMAHTHFNQACLMKSLSSIFEHFMPLVPF